MMTISRAIFTALGFTVALAGCSEGSESSDVQKFESSELHALGASCDGPYFSVEGGNFVLIEQGEKTRITQKNVQLADLGSHRLAMTASYGKFSIVSTFILLDNNTVAKLDNVATVPEPTAEQLDRAKLPRDYMSKEATKVRESIPTMVLCPRSASTPSSRTGLG